MMEEFEKSPLQEEIYALACQSPNTAHIPIICCGYAMLHLLPEPDRTLVATAAFTGLRKSELKALQWSDYNGESLSITRSMWRKFMGQPKSKASRGQVPVIPVLRKLLDEHRAKAGNPADGFMFRGPRLSHPINPDNLAHDRIKLILRKANSPVRWLGWHAFRRGLATNLHALGIDDMTISKILRHSDVTITQKCYVKVLAPAVEAAMTRFDHEVSRFVQ
jgi:integrase